MPRRSEIERIEHLQDELQVLKAKNAELQEIVEGVAVVYKRQNKEAAASETQESSNGSAKELTPEELQEKLRRMELNGFFKDEAVKNLQIANTAIVDQLKGRWNFVQGMVTSVITFLFAAAFVWQLYNAGAAQSLNNRINEASKQLEEQRKEINKQVNEQGNLLAQMTEGIVTLNNSSRDWNRNRFSQAARRAQIASAQLEMAYEHVKAEASDKQKETGKSSGSSLTDAGKIDLISPLQYSVKQLLMAAYEMEARSYFSIANQYDLDNVKEADRYRLNMQRMMGVATKMISLDPNLWEGHHYAGLYLADSVSKKPAEVEYRQSVDLDNELKLDLINLAELNFIDEKFPEAMEWAENYLRHDLEPAVEHKVVCTFFARMSHYLLPNTAGDQDIRTIKTMLASVKPGFGKNYSFTDLQKYRNDIQSGKKLTRPLYTGKRKQVLEMIDLLVKKGNEKPKGS